MLSTVTRSNAVAAAAHRREHHSLLAAAEKRLLVAIAGRLPAWVTSDLLSGLGLASMCAAGASFALFRITPHAGWLVLVALVANWFGDSLDGTVARVRHHERPRYGFYVDHVIDLAGAVFLLTGLALSGLMSPVVALVLLVAFLLVSAETYLSTATTGVFKLSFAGVGPTELRLLLVAGALRAMAGPSVSMPWGDMRLFDVGGLIGAAGLCAAFLVAAVRQTCALYRAEPLPSEANRRRP